MTDQSLATIQPRELPAVLKFSTEQVDLIKRTICAGSSDAELALFMEVCKSKRLDPFNREIHAVMRSSKEGGNWVKKMTIQTGIDGYRVMAERTGLYEGTTAPQWCGHDGHWRDVWLEDEPPTAARIGIYRKGWREPMYRVARYKSYVQQKDGKPNAMWAKMPDGQLAKCAEALAFRATFPGSFGEILTDEEMGHDEENVIPHVATVVEEPRPHDHLPPKADNAELTPQDITLLRNETYAVAKQLGLEEAPAWAKMKAYATRTHGMHKWSDLTRVQYNEVFDAVALELAPPSEEGE